MAIACMRNDDDSDQGEGGKGGQQQSESRYILKGDPTRFAEGLELSRMTPGEAFGLTK